MTLVVQLLLKLLFCRTFYIKIGHFFLCGDLIVNLENFFWNYSFDWHFWIKCGPYVGTSSWIYWSKFFWNYSFDEPFRSNAYLFLLWGPHREFSGPTSFEITVLPDLLDKMRTFSLELESHGEFIGPISFQHINLSDLLDEMRTFSQIWGPHSEFTGSTSFENIILHDLID